MNSGCSAREALDFVHTDAGIPLVDAHARFHQVRPEDREADLFVLRGQIHPSGVCVPH